MVDVSCCSCPGRQKACISGCEEPEVSSAEDISEGMVCTWKGPAAHAICCADVKVAWENKNIVLPELCGWDIYDALVSTSLRSSIVAHLFHKLSTTDDNCGVVTLLGLFVVHVKVFVRLFQMPWNNKLEFPCTLLPQIIETWNPTSSGIRRGWSSVGMRHSLQ